MASSQPSSTAQKSSSRWGSFLAGVESRLDTILADEDTRAPTRGDGPVQEQPGKKGGMVVAAPGKTGPPRSASTNTAQDRLNERLAKAMVGRSLGKKGDSSIASSGVPSRTASPTNVTLSPRTSLDLQGKPKGEQELTMNNSPSEGQEAQRDNSEAAPNGAEPMNQSPIVAIEEALNKPRGLAESHAPIAAPQPFEMTRPTSPKVSDSSKPNGVLVDTSFEAPEQYEKVIELMRSDHEIAELQRQEEMHTYLERIDALQSKLQYLTNEAADLSKKASVEAQPGSLEQMIASKDEKIALLIEEGEKLSQTELKHMGIIKKLRAKSADDDKSIIESKRAVERYEKAAKEAQERTRRIESAEKRASERLKGLGKLEKDLEAVKVDRDAKESLVQDLQFQLTQATSAAKEAEFKANSEALEAEKRHVADLTDELSKTKVEKDLAEKQHQNELRELRERAEREKERAKVAEMERQGERNILESRLEACRARVEEVSAGQGGDMQAKLLRQIETLQNQYAVASENWQGIEGSLLSRVTALEKEKDDVAKREADVRRKARETSMKYRRLEEELERVKSKAEDMDHELISRSNLLATLHERLAKSEAEVRAAREILKSEREAWEVRLAQSSEEEKARLREETARSTPDTLYQQFRTDSPTTNNWTHKSSYVDRSQQGRRVQGLAISGTIYPSIERPLSRHSSSQLLQNSQYSELTPQCPVSRHESLSTVPQLSVNHSVPETPSITDRDDEFFNGFHTPATPERTINDLISVSTAGAGPSVQLVERMSAAVRRLESEKASHRDELSRLSAQRDEARDQVVALMKEAEEKRGWESRVKELETEMKGVEERYLTTLEMLGEKSERVEELKADVQDLKGMYRELVENTMR